MKATHATSRPVRSVFPALSEVISFACLLLFASILAIAGGVASSVLFFGLLLVFSLLLLTVRHLTRKDGERVKQLSPN